MAMASNLVAFLLLVTTTTSQHSEFCVAPLFVLPDSEQRRSQRLSERRIQTTLCQVIPDKKYRSQVRSESGLRERKREGKKEKTKKRRSQKTSQKRSTTNQKRREGSGREAVSICRITTGNNGGKFLFEVRTQ